MDHNGEFLDEMSGKQLNSEEVMASRLDQIKSLHTCDEKVPMERCWNSFGRAPVEIKWMDISKGDKVNHDYRRRSIAKELKLDKRLDLFSLLLPHLKPRKHASEQQ